MRSSPELRLCISILALGAVLKYNFIIRVITKIITVFLIYMDVPFLVAGIISKNIYIYNRLIKTVENEC